MERPEFVYTTYIRTTPERLWQALTDPAFTRRCWNVTIASEWQVGATMTWTRNGITIADPEQVVLDYESYRRLSYTWFTFTPAFESAVVSDELLAKVRQERRSKVTFEIEPLGERVKLTVTHDNFDPGSAVLERVSNGWPRVLGRTSKRYLKRTTFCLRTDQGSRARCLHKEAARVREKQRLRPEEKPCACPGAESG